MTDLNKHVVVHKHLPRVGKIYLQAVRENLVRRDTLLRRGLKGLADAVYFRTWLETVNSMEELANRLEGAMQEIGRTCTWSWMDNPESTADCETECKQAWTFTDGSAEENDVHFCPFCGGLVIHPTKDDYKEEEDNGVISEHPEGVPEGDHAQDPGAERPHR